MTLATGGDYFLFVSGVGTGDPTTGYSGYDSLGRYTLTGTVAPVLSGPPCTQTLTGAVRGPFTVESGRSLCVTNARVVGPITVNPGGALTIDNSQVANGIVATSPAFFSLCGSVVTRPSRLAPRALIVTNATVPLQIGDPANGCATNRVAGDVVLRGNTAGLTLGSTTSPARWPWRTTAARW